MAGRADETGLGIFDRDTIYPGDALELMPVIPDGVIDLIVTDPPFAIDFKAQRENYNRTGSNVMEGYQEIPESDYLEFTHRWMTEAARILAPEREYVCFFRMEPSPRYS